jgi:hypothetical protein
MGLVPLLGLSPSPLLAAPGTPEDPSPQENPRDSVHVVARGVVTSSRPQFQMSAKTKSHMSA